MDPSLPPRPRPPSPPRAYPPSSVSSTASTSRLAVPQPPIPVRDSSAGEKVQTQAFNPALTRPRPPTPPQVRPPSATLAFSPNRAPLDLNSPASEHTDDLQVPPTYHQLAQSEPGNPRFGRWRGWIEKRSQERQSNDTLDGQTSQARPGRWDLEDQPADDYGAVNRYSQTSALYNELNSTAQSTQDLATGQPSPGPSRLTARERIGSNVSRPHRLTVNSFIHPLGSRFARGLPDRPRCAAPLGVHVVDGVTMDRFLLIGTDEGLYLADLFPSLSSGSLQTSTSSLREDIAKYPIWTGLAVLQLDIFAESNGPLRSRKDGVVFALVRPHSSAASLDPSSSGSQDLEIRMWSLSAIENLARWRACSETSSSLPLNDLLRSTASSPSKRSGKASPSKQRQPHSSIESAADESDGSKRVSRGFFQAIYDSANALAGESRSKGKQRARRQQNSDGDDTVSGGTSLGSRSAASSSVTSINNQDPIGNLELPLEWASSFVDFPLPRSHTHGRVHGHGAGVNGPLFYELVHLPLVDGLDDKRGWLVLLVATRQVVYVFESKPADKRIWSLSKELYAPAPPRVLGLVRVPSSPVLTRRVSTKHHSRTQSVQKESGLPRDLAVFLGMSNKAALINLVDASVQELDSSMYSSQEQPSPVKNRRTHGSSMSGSLAPDDGLGRARSRSSVSASSASSAAAAAVVAKVTALVEGKSAIPAGMRGADVHKSLSIGRKLGDTGSAPPMSVSMSAGAGSGSGGGTGSGRNSVDDQRRWVGCEPLVLPTSSGPVQLWLVTRGRTTEVWKSPIELKTLGNENDAFAPVPLHVFNWSSAPAPITCVLPLLRSSRSSHSTHRVHLEDQLVLVLTAFTASGMCVQEHLINLAPGASTVFRPLSSLPCDQRPIVESSLAVPLEAESDQNDLEDIASFDYGRDIQVLAPGGSAVRPNLPSDGGEYDDDEDHEYEARGSLAVQDSSRRTRGGVYIAVQGHSDWSLAWVG